MRITCNAPHAYVQGDTEEDLEDLLQHIATQPIPDAAPPDAPPLQPVTGEDPDIAGFGKLNYSKHGTEMDTALSDNPQDMPRWTFQKCLIDTEDAHRCKWTRDFHLLVTGKVYPGIFYRRAVRIMYTAEKMMELHGWQVNGAGGGAQRHQQAPMHKRHHKQATSLTQCTCCLAHICACSWPS